MSNKLARSVSVIGAGYTPIGLIGQGPLEGMSERELFAWASLEAMKNANIRADEIDAYYVGMSGPNFYSRTKSAAPHFGAWIGMENKPSLFHDGACGTGAIGLQMAVQAVASGMYDCVISTCVNCTSTSPLYSQPPFLRETLPYDELWNGIYTAFDPAYEKPGTMGVSGTDFLIGLYARKYGYTMQDIDEACVNWMSVHRKLALTNERATAYSITYEEQAKQKGFDDLYSYLTSRRNNPKMSSYIRSLQMGLPRDGAGAVIVCATDLAKKYVEKPIEVAGIATCTLSTKDFDSIPWENQRALFRTIYDQAGDVDPLHDIDWMYVHDCPCGQVLPVTEAAGFVREGEAMEYMKKTGFGLDGDKHMNTGGGRAQLGHPLAPALNIEISECIDQMRGEAGARQLETPPRYGLFWVAGSGYNIGALLLRNTQR